MRWDTLQSGSGGPRGLNVGGGLEGGSVRAGGGQGALLLLLCARHRRTGGKLARHSETGSLLNSVTRAGEEDVEVGGVSRLPC